MIERRIGLDAVREQLVDEPVVEIEPLRIGLARSIRKHPRPRNREAVGLDAERLNQRDVVLVAVIVLVGAVAGRAVLDLAGRVAENVPDRLAAAVLVDGALDLVGRGRRAPQKILGKGRVAIGRCGRLIICSLVICNLVIRSPGTRRCTKRGEPRELRKIAPRDIS
ncbi:hypothetical protein ABID65_001004 [Bradyrhizobium sp. S3.9.2]